MYSVSDLPHVYLTSALRYVLFLLPYTLQTIA